MEGFFLDDSTRVEEFLEFWGMVLSSVSNQIPSYLFQDYATCFGAENTGRKSQVSRQLQLFFKKFKLRVYPRQPRSIILSRDDESLKTSWNIDKRFLVVVS